MRARLIKPEFFDDEDLCKQALGARILFAGLWCLADREGRLRDIPRRIAIDVFPHDHLEEDVAVWLENLNQAGIIARYRVGGLSCIAIPGFPRHQKVNPHEKPSQLPPPPSGSPLVNQVSTIDQPLVNQAPTIDQPLQREAEAEAEAEAYARDARNGREGTSPDLSEIAQAIHKRHLSGRKGSLQQTEHELATICMATPSPLQTAQGIDQRHASWCASERWREQGGKFVPHLGLKWLPRQAFDDPPRASSAPSSYISIDEIERRRT